MQDKSGKFEDERNSLLDMQNLNHGWYLPLSQNPRAAAQGALAIEARQEDEKGKRNYFYYLK